ncbi:MAG: hypothetical protein WCF67_12030, partial [Chitinophagaceae bacterium]
IIMSDIKSIAGNYLESATKLQENSIKYIVGLSILVLFCWVFAEKVFQRTKIDAIRLNKLEEKIDSLKLTLSLSNDAHQSQSYNSLKETAKVQDSIDANTYKAIEENIPQVFRLLLRHATKKPFGILLTAVTILSFLIYLFTLRRRYLRRLAIGLRILKEEGGYNRVYDYNISLPFWSFPLFDKSTNGVTKDDLIVIGGARENKRSYYFSVLILLLCLLFIQVRLYYISLVLNSYSLNWIFVIQAIALFLSVGIIIVWFLPAFFTDSYNNEQVTHPYTRRNFITVSSLFATGLLLGLFSHSLSKVITANMLKPRFLVKHKTKKLSNCRIIELMAIEKLKTGDLVKAADVLYNTLMDKKNFRLLENYTRLFDLLIIVCYRNKEVYDTKFRKIISLAKKTNHKVLVARSREWEKASRKKIKAIASRDRWDKIPI